MKLSVFFDHILEATEQTGKTLSEILNEVKIAGIDGIEINLSYLLEHESIISEFEKAGLCVSSIFSFYEMNHRDESEHAKKHVEMAVRSGAKNILVVPGFLTEEEGIKLKACKGQYEVTAAFMEANQSVQRMLKQMKYICELGKQHDIWVTVEDLRI